MFDRRETARNSRVSPTSLFMSATLAAHTRIPVYAPPACVADPQKAAGLAKQVCATPPNFLSPFFSDVLRCLRWRSQARGFGVAVQKELDDLR